MVFTGELSYENDVGAGYIAGGLPVTGLLSYLCTTSFGNCVHITMFLRLIHIVCRTANV